MTPRKRRTPRKPPEVVTLSVQMTVDELAALSLVVMSCVSAVDQMVANAAEQGYRKVRAAAKKHPRTPVTR